VYRGSYKALLEEYDTLTDMDYMIAKALSSPLAKITRFGMFG
jgi:hypothetical protein